MRTESYEYSNKGTTTPLTLFDYCFADLVARYCSSRLRNNAVVLLARFLQKFGHSTAVWYPDKSKVCQIQRRCLSSEDQPRLSNPRVSENNFHSAHARCTVITSVWTLGVSGTARSGRTRRAGRAPAWERTLIGRSTAKMSSDDHPAQTPVNDAVQIRLALLVHTVARRSLLSICRHRVQLVSEFIRRVWLPPSPSLTLFLLLLSLL